MKRKIHQQNTAWVIDDLQPVNDRCVKVLVHSTGKWCTLPRRYIDFQPGLVFLPIWLAAKIKGEGAQCTY